MKEKNLEEVLEKEGFNIHYFIEDNENCAEIETWTEGGVNMVFHLIPFTIEKFKELAKDFDIDEQIDLHRQDERYKKSFSIKESLDDFDGFQKRLKRISDSL